MKIVKMEIKDSHIAIFVEHEGQKKYVACGIEDISTVDELENMFKELIYNIRKIDGYKRPC